MATESNTSFGLFVYNDGQTEADAKQVVLDVQTGEFREVTSTNMTMLRLRTTTREAMESILAAMRGVYPEPYHLVIKEINRQAEDIVPESGQIVFLPEDHAGGVKIQSILSKAAHDHRKRAEEQIRQLKAGSLIANRNVLNINHAINDAMRVQRHG